ncbi:hypothetical protein B0H19DRAFT_1080628 [Mycena capillaripes]|nr:hypothetical protein B0H19DRAFT_1080628 [Mycena capillaripes]
MQMETPEEPIAVVATLNVGRERAAAINFIVQKVDDTYLRSPGGDEETLNVTKDCRSLPPLLSLLGSNVYVVNVVVFLFAPQPSFSAWLTTIPSETLPSQQDLVTRFK